MAGFRRIHPTSSSGAKPSLLLMIRRGCSNQSQFPFASYLLIDFRNRPMSALLAINRRPGRLWSFLQYPLTRFLLAILFVVVPVMGVSRPGDVNTLEGRTGISHGSEWQSDTRRWLAACSRNAGKSRWRQRAESRRTEYYFRGANPVVRDRYWKLLLLFG